MKIVHELSCRCGACRIQTYTKPLGTVNCHCSKCRHFSGGQEKATVSFFWRPAVAWQGPTVTTLTTVMGGLVAIQRRKCATCHQPVYEKGIRGATGLAFVFLSNNSQNDKVKPECNIYYASGHQKGQEGLLTMHSDLASLMYCNWLFIKGVPQLMYVLLMRSWEYWVPTPSQATTTIKQE